tara:strand:- start:275 stop:517 length:243 start_codon:yes stop_codon:yes gene_type:complete
VGCPPKSPKATEVPSTAWMTVASKRWFVGSEWLAVCFIEEPHAESVARRIRVPIVAVVKETIRLIVKRLAMGALGNYSYE